MIVATFVPGAVLAAANHTLPAEFPDLAAITNAQLIRVTAQLTATLTHAQLIAAVDDHAQAAVVGALADHAQAAVVGALADHAQAAIVGALADHAAHGHDITTVAAAGGGTAMLTPAVAGPLEGGAQTNPGAVDVLAAAQAHAAGAAAVAHAAGAAAVAHAAGAAAVVHAAAAGGPVGATLTGADPTINVLAANITLVDRRTFSFAAQATALGDILILRYLEVGSYPRVA